MNYEKIYNQIIEKAKSECRMKNKEIYYERHHIIPKCLGGSNHKDNLVLLTAKEHFICHKLLTEMYPDNIKLLYAFSAMYMTNKGRIKFSSKSFETCKQRLNVFKSEFLKNNNPMKDITLRNKKRHEMTGDSNLMHRLTSEQKIKHSKSVSISKIGGKNPNSKKCMYSITQEKFNSGAELVRVYKLKGSVNYLAKKGIIIWI